MKIILLLAAIYSLIIHQSRKNNDRIMPGIEAAILKNIPDPAVVSAGLVTLDKNDSREKVNAGNTRLNTTPAFVLWSGRK